LLLDVLIVEEMYHKLVLHTHQVVLVVLVVLVVVGEDMMVL
jgi:hypothetical protein